MTPSHFFQNTRRLIAHVKLHAYGRSVWKYSCKSICLIPVTQILEVFWLEKCQPFKCNFRFGNGNKSHGAEYSEHNGCSRISAQSCTAIDNQMFSAQWPGTLLWCRIIFFMSSYFCLSTVIKFRRLQFTKCMEKKQTLVVKKRNKRMFVRWFSLSDLFWAVESFQFCISLPIVSSLPHFTFKQQQAKNHWYNEQSPLFHIKLIE